MLFQLNVSHLAACCASSSYSAVKHASLSTYLSRNVSASARRSAVALVHVELSVRFLSGQCRVEPVFPGKRKQLFISLPSYASTNTVLFSSFLSDPAARHLVCTCGIADSIDWTV